MKPGKEYEVFVYEVFSDLFKDAEVVLNDKILGIQSGIFREIDVSVRIAIEGMEILYIVQAKDHAKPADIKILGEFSASIKDVGAAKGFLVCSSGFAKTNHQYARTLGIELLSVEDIDSKKWKAKIEIPIVYVDYELQYDHAVAMGTMSEFGEFMSKNKVTQITVQDRDSFRVGTESKFLSIADRISTMVRDRKISFDAESNFTFLSIVLKKFPSHVFPSATLKTKPCKKFYLKYISPNKYRGIRDHLNNSIIPTNFKIENLPTKRDNTFAEISENDIPISATGIMITIDAKPNKAK